MMCKPCQTAQRVSVNSCSTADTHETLLCNDRLQEPSILLRFQCNCCNIDMKFTARCTHQQCSLNDAVNHTKYKSSHNDQYRTISMQSSMMSGDINCRPFSALYKRHLHSNSSLMFSRVTIFLVIILSMFSSVSSAHKLPWTSWSIDNTTLNVTDVVQDPHSFQLRVPDLITVAGHIFHYQIETDAFNTSSTYFQAREAGRNNLPLWLSFNETSTTFQGIPLLTDKGKLYIALNVYSSISGRTVETLFSISVVSSTKRLEDKEENQHSFNRTDCRSNFHLSLDSVPSYPHCSDGSSPIIASVITFLNMRKISGFTRAGLFLTLADTLDICPDLLVVESVEWSSKNGMKLWSQLAEYGIIENLELTTTISFQLSCSVLDYTNKSFVQILSHLDDVISNQPMTEVAADDETILFLRWFISKGSHVLQTSIGAPQHVHDRLRRQSEMGLETEPGIDFLHTTVLPDLMVSSSTAVSSAMGTSSTSLSSIQLSTSQSSGDISKTNAIVSSTVSSMESLNAPVSSREPVTPQFSGQISSTMYRTSSDIMIPSTSDILSHVLLPTTQHAVPSGMISHTMPTATHTVVASPSIPIIGPSSRVIPSSELTPVLEPSSQTLTMTPSLSLKPSSTALSPLTSSDNGPHLVVGTSMPVLIFSMQSFLTSLPVLTESPSYTVRPSHSFIIQSNIDDLPSSTQDVPSPTLSSLAVPDASTSIVLTSVVPPSPTATTVLPSLTPDVSSSILMPDSSTLFLQSPSISLRLMPDSSTLFLQSPSISLRLMPDSSTLFLQSPSISLRPTSSDVLPSSTIITTASMTTTVSMTSTLPTTTQFASRSSSPILVQTLSLSIEPSPSLSIPIPTSEILMSDSTILPSIDIPVSSPELTLTVRPSPVPSSMVIVPTLSASSSPIQTSMFPSDTIITLPSFTPAIDTSFLMLMPTSDTSVSLSIIFTQSSSSLIQETLIQTSEPLTILATQTTMMFPESTTSMLPSFLFTTVLPTSRSHTSTSVPSRSSILTLFPTQTIMSSIQEPSSSIVDVFQTTQVVLTATTILSTSPSPTLLSPSSSPTLLSPSPSPTLLSPSSSPTLPSPSSSPTLQSPSSSPTLQSPSPSSTSPSISTTLIPSPSLSPTPTLTFCEEFNIDCGNGTCLNDSAINQTTFEFCDCYPDYTGPFCNDAIDNCNPLQCFVNGTRVCINGNGTFTCDCAEGFTGDLCDEEIDGCLSSPCMLLNATCVNLGMGEFQCHCPQGYSGRFCESDIDPCDPNPCTINQTCTIINSQNFTCDILTNSTVALASSSMYIAIISQVVSSVNMTAIISTVRSLEVTSSSIQSSTASSQPTPTPSSTLKISSSLMIPTPRTTTSMISPSLTPSPPVLNQNPILLNPIGTLIVNRGQIFQFSIPDDTFYDAESGTTESLSLTLLNFRGEPLPNATWVQVNQGHLEGVPLMSEIINEAITDHLFILQAQDDTGSSAHDFVTIRVLPLGPSSSLLTVLFDNAFEEVNQNLTQKISLVQRLSSSAISTSPATLRKRQLQIPPQTYNTEQIFIDDIFDESPLAVSYKNLSIADFDCADFHEWIENIYNFTNDEYTQRFLEVMAPEFHPTPTPRIEGVCSIVSTNIPPTLSDDIEIDVSDSTLSHRIVLLSTLVPAACLALCCLLIGLCALCMYRRKRSERKYLTSRRLYLNRRPIILDGEVDLPDRRRLPFIFEGEIDIPDQVPQPGQRQPIILPNEIALQEEHDGLNEEEEEEEDDDRYSNASSDDVMAAPPADDRQRLLQEPHVPPPIYRLPPQYIPGHIRNNPHAR